jgi:hypothetical protein
MAWCEPRDVTCIRGLPGNAVLERLVEHAADDLRIRRAKGEAPKMRC